MLEVGGRLVEASEALVEQVLCWGLHARRGCGGLERCVAIRMI